MSDFDKSVNLFTDKAVDYTRFRPSYPKEAVELILSLCANKHELTIADIGSGTGKLSKLLLSERINLYAVEPNADMRAEAEKELSSHQNFHSIDGTGENTTLASDSVDIITIAEAYHWFDNEQSNCEFKRILKSDGYVVLLWNIFGGNPYDHELSILNKRLCESHKDKKSRATKDERAVHLFGEGNYTKCEFDNTILQPLEGFLG